MEHLLVDLFIVYFCVAFLAPNLRRGKLRRTLEVVQWPLVRFGIWYRWSMYAPEVPTATQIALAGVRLDDDAFEVVPMPGFNDDAGFEKARSLRFIHFQWVLCDPVTDYLKPAFCDHALRRWRGRHSAPGAGAGVGEAAAVAVEIRAYSYPSPEPGRRTGVPEAEVRTVWNEPLTA